MCFKFCINDINVIKDWYKRICYLLHHKSLPKISLNLFNLIFNDETKSTESYEGVNLLKYPKFL